MKRSPADTLSAGPDTTSAHSAAGGESAGSQGAIADALPDLGSLPSSALPVSPAPPVSLPVDPWLTAPHTPPQRVADTRRQPMRLSALFEEFCHFLRVEKGATPATIATYRWCFGDFQAFVMKQVGGTVLLAHFTEETCRRYQYDLAGRELKSGTIRLRVATLGSFGKWMVRRDKLVRNPVDRLTRPRRKARVPAVPTWDTVKMLLRQCDLRERTILALMAYGGLRRGEVAALDVGDVAPDFGLRRVMGKGGHEVPVALPARARAILRDYIATERAGLPATAPLFVVTYKNRVGQRIERRITGQRIWKLIKAVGARAGISALHPHALRHACGAQLLRRTKNLRVVQEQLRHVDVQTTTGYTRLTQQDVRQALEMLDDEGE
jgi:site-specific recombinase XerD